MNGDPVNEYSKRVRIGTHGRITKEITILDNPTRQAIIYLLAAQGPMTLKDISEELKLAPSTVYEHLRKLREAGFIVEASEHPKRFKVEVFYRLTLPFILASEIRVLEEKLSTYLDTLKNSITKTISDVEKRLKELGILRYVNEAPESVKENALKNMALALVVHATHMFLYEIIGGSLVYALVNDLEESTEKHESLIDHES